MKPVALISAPTLAARFPSFQLALLKPTLERAGFAVEPMSLFLRFAEQIGWELNEALADVYPCMVGEWIWAGAAFGEPPDTDEYLSEFGADLELIAGHAGCSVSDIIAVREHKTAAFIDWALHEIDWSAYSLVGFSVVFQQMVASLALAKPGSTDGPGRVALGQVILIVGLWAWSICWSAQLFLLGFRSGLSADGSGWRG